MQQKEGSKTIVETFTYLSLYRAEFKEFYLIYIVVPEKLDI